MEVSQSELDELINEVDLCKVNERVHSLYQRGAILKMAAENLHLTVQVEYHGRGSSGAQEINFF